MKTLKSLYLLLLTGLLAPSANWAQKPSEQDKNLLQQCFVDEMRYQLNLGEVQRLYRMLLEKEKREFIRDFGGKEAYKFTSLRKSYDVSTDSVGMYLMNTASRYFKYIKLPKTIQTDRNNFIKNIKSFQQEARTLPSFYATIEHDFGGDIEAYADCLYEHSIFSSILNYTVFNYSQSAQQLLEDPFVLFSISLRTYLAQAEKE